MTDDTSFPQPPDHDSSDREDLNKNHRPKGTRKKLIVVGVVLLVLVIAGWFAYKLLAPTSGPRINPLHMVPPNALFILETDKPYNLWKKVGQTRIWEILESDEELRDYGTMLHDLEETLSEFDQALDLLSGREVYISGHTVRLNQTDYLYIVDIGGLGVIQTWLTNSGDITKRSFEEQTIYERFDADSRESFYFTFVENLMILSANHVLVENSIQEQAKATLYREYKFKDVHEKVRKRGLARLYLNEQQVYSDLSGDLSSKDIQLVKESLPLMFSGLYLDVEQHSILLRGHSSYEDSASSLLRVVINSGTGGLDIASIAPANTSVYLGLGFDSFKKFYRTLAQDLNDENWKTYSRKTEKLLDISLEEDIADWIDDEMALIQFESKGQSETALILKGKGNVDVGQKMAFLSKQIRRKTPVRFNEMLYKGYPVNYMAVKGLFKLLFGGLFDEYDRPYYTIIDNYVVFGSSPMALWGIINNHLEQTVLAENPSFQTFSEKMNGRHSLMMYVQLPLLGESKDGLIDNETIAYLKSKESMLSHFPQLAFKIIPGGAGLFETEVLLSVEHTGALEAQANTPTPPVSEDFDKLLVDPGEQIVIDDIEIEDLAAKKQTGNYEEGEPQYEVDLKDGLKHGSYYEYYPSGELKVKGKYRKGLREGTWKYYEENGDLIKKDSYKKDRLVGRDF